ncbi:hypothetical protein CUMW_058950 [Citrus unshiu]|nr:hypothetical protein CUMW_058950 [Citrus unshiu]
MARIANLLLALSVLCIMGMAKAGTITELPSHNGDSIFIETSCKSTRYRTVCVQSLLPYAYKIQRSPLQMALEALSVSLSRTKSADAFVSNLVKHKDLKPREQQPIDDCLQLMGDSIDRLSKSVQELRGISGANDRDFLWHISNVQTWVSAALTDDDTCLDGLAALDGEVKDSIRTRVSNVAEVTSNALALVNQLAKTHLE